MSAFGPLFVGGRVMVVIVTLPSALGDPDPAARAAAFEHALLTSFGFPCDPGDESLPWAEWAATYEELSRALTVDRERALAAAPSASVTVREHAALIARLIYAARTFQVAHRILRAYPPPPGRFVEVGAGIGPFALASSVLAPNGAATLVDLEAAPLERARALFAAAGAPPPKTIVAREADWAGGLSIGGAAAIALPHVLNEVVAAARGTRAPAARDVDIAVTRVEQLLAQLKAGGRLYIVEPGLRSTSRLVQELRDRLAPRVRVLAPCVHAGPCPLLPRQEDWCHFTWPAELGPVARRVADRAHRRHQETHFAWLVLEAGDPLHPEVNLARVLERRGSKPKSTVRLCAGPEVIEVVALRRAAAAHERLERLVPGQLVSIDRDRLDPKGDGLRMTAPEALTPMDEI